MEKPTMANQDSHGAARPRRSVWRKLSMYVCGLAILAGCLTLRHFWGPEAASAKGPLSGLLQKAAPKVKEGVQQASATAPREIENRLQIMAVVNGEEIGRNELAKYCLWHYGKPVLESMVNKKLILDRCKELNLEVTASEIDQEIDRVARKFALPVDQWLKMLKEERNIAPEQYAGDIILPTLALRKLAADQMQITPEELAKAKETYYGEAVKALLIACDQLDKAREAHAKALANPADFGNLAKEYSDDVNSASTKGMIQPIRRHMGDPKIEEAAFKLQPGQISDIIPAGNQFIILKCEAFLPPRQPPANYEENLKETIREAKLRDAASTIFKQLQDKAVIEIVFNDPEKSKQYPGVAALVNERKISTVELAEECIARHGAEVLTGVISRRVLEQACKQRNLAISVQDEDQELAHAAALMGKVDKAGQPDIEAWLTAVEQEQGIDRDIYIHDAIWPSVALKKLVGNTVEITQEDLQKGYQANYGPRVRCLAIVMNNHRQAQEVWEKARANPTPEFFGDLAEQYSVEASSRALRGEVRPIQRHGGQPALEQEAFSLQPGELSSVIQVGDKYVILRCEGFTTPTKVNFEEVKELIAQDLRDKKLRIAMSREYDRLMETAQIDNYLAGTTQSGKRPPSSGGLRPAAGQPQLEQLPGSARSPAAVPQGARPATGSIRPAVPPARR
jgi:parvulin-like peptidyl-prolyl isomerase